MMTIRTLGIKMKEFVLYSLFFLSLLNISYRNLDMNCSSEGKVIIKVFVFETTD